MRDEMLGAVVRRAMEHPDFREKLMDSPDEALQAHGFALERDDMDRLNAIRSELDGGNGEGTEDRLLAIAERLGVHPHPDRTAAAKNTDSTKGENNGR